MTATELSAVFDATSGEFDDVTPQVWGPAGAALVAATRLRTGAGSSTSAAEPA